jgi:hypothetical protein
MYLKKENYTSCTIVYYCEAGYTKHGTSVIILIEEYTTHCKAVNILEEEYTDTSHSSKFLKAGYTTHGTAVKSYSNRELYRRWCPELTEHTYIKSYDN